MIERTSRMTCRSSDRPPAEDVLAWAWTSAPADWDDDEDDIRASCRCDEEEEEDGVAMGCRCLVWVAVGGRDGAKRSSHEPPSGIRRRSRNSFPAQLSLSSTLTRKMSVPSHPASSSSAGHTLDEVVVSLASDLPVVGDQDPEDEDDLDDEDEDESPATTSAAAAAGEGSAAKKNKKKKKKSKAKKAVDALKYVSSRCLPPLPPSPSSKDRPRTDSTSALRPFFAGVYRQAMPGNRDIPDAIMDRVMEEVGKLPEGQDKDQRTFLDTSCSP